MGRVQEKEISRREQESFTLEARERGEERSLDVNELFIRREKLREIFTERNSYFRKVSILEEKLSGAR